MALRPIDLNLNVQHASDMARAGGNNNLNARPGTAQQMFAERLEKQTRQLEQQVIKSNQSEKGQIQRDGRGNAGRYQSQRRPAKKKPAKGQVATDHGGSESMLDIKI